MYDQLEENIPQKRFTPSNRVYPNTKIHEFYALQPWEKSTLELQLKNQQISRQIKTFYNAPELRTQERQYRTQRGFYVQNQTQRRENRGERPKSLAEASKKSAISHYNISGNILGQKIKSPKSLPFQFPVKRNKSFRLKEIPKSKDSEDIDQIYVNQSVIAMKKRLSLHKQRASDGFIMLDYQNTNDPVEKVIERKRSKVISLGYQKLARFKGLGKQRSLQFNINSSQT